MTTVRKEDEALLPVLITPEAFCWFYAAACEPGQMAPEPLSKDEYNHVEFCRRAHIIPTDNEIRRWYPRPFAELERRDLECTLENMQYYWRVLHMSDEENTPVCHFKLIRPLKRGSGVWMAQNKDRGLERIINMHGLELHPEDLVYVHGMFIIEMMKLKR